MVCVSIGKMSLSDFSSVEDRANPTPEATTLTQTAVSRQKNKQLDWQIVTH